MSTRLLLICTPMLFLQACIGDDIILDTVDPVVRILDHPDTLAVGDTWLFEARYLNAIGREEEQTVRWASLDAELLAIDGEGLATGLARGNTAVVATVMPAGLPQLADTVAIVVGDQTASGSGEGKAGTLRTTSSYVLEGDFSLEPANSGITLALADNYRASSALPGLYVYLTNNPNSVADAFEIGEVTVFAGAHSYSVAGVGLADYSHLLYYCKPFNVKVGDGLIE